MLLQQLFTAHKHHGQDMLASSSYQQASMLHNGSADLVWSNDIPDCPTDAMGCVTSRHVPFTWLVLPSFQCKTISHVCPAAQEKGPSRTEVASSAGSVIGRGPAACDVSCDDGSGSGESGADELAAEGGGERGSGGSVLPVSGDSVAQVCGEGSDGNGDGIGGNAIGGGGDNGSGGSGEGGDDDGNGGENRGEDQDAGSGGGGSKGDLLQSVLLALSCN